MEPFETSRNGRLVHLTYFAPSGTYSGEAGYRTHYQNQTDIASEVEQMRDEGKLPGLAGIRSVTVLINGWQRINSHLLPANADPAAQDPKEEKSDGTV